MSGRSPCLHSPGMPVTTGTAPLCPGPEPLRAGGLGHPTPGFLLRPEEMASLWGLPGSHLTREACGCLTSVGILPGYPHFFGG